MFQMVIDLVLRYCYWRRMESDSPFWTGVQKVNWLLQARRLKRQVASSGVVQSWPAMMSGCEYWHQEIRGRQAQQVQFCYWMAARIWNGAGEQWLNRDRQVVRMQRRERGRGRGLGVLIILLGIQILYVHMQSTHPYIHNSGNHTLNNSGNQYSNKQI